MGLDFAAVVGVSLVRIGRKLQPIVVDEGMAQLKRAPEILVDVGELCRIFLIGLLRHRNSR